MAEKNKFEPKKYMIKLKGKDYLEVKFRLHWFRLEKMGWQIKTEIIKLDLLRGIAVVRADVIDDKGVIISTGHKMEYQKHFFDFLEKAETGAIGRALSALGYGTLQCFDLDEGIELGRIADAPVNFSDNVNNTPSKKASSRQKAFIYNLMNDLNIDKNYMMQIFFDCAKREIKSSNDLTVQEASKVIESLKEQQIKSAKVSTVMEELPFATEPPSSANPFVKFIPTGEDAILKN